MKGIDEMNVSLTPELEKRIAEKVKSGLYQTASEVVREAMRRFFESESKGEPGFVAKSNEDLEYRLLEGLDSGSPTPMTGADWSRLRRRTKARFKKRRQ
jgi:antitoxin ParD1/3/4